MRAARTAFGGAIDTRASVTPSLIGICVVIFGLEYVAGVNRVLGDYGSWPFGIAVEGQPWRLFTAMFLHVNLLHLLFNMYVLYLIGPQLERLSVTSATSCSISSPASVAASRRSGSATRTA